MATKTVSLDARLTRSYTDYTLYIGDGGNNYLKFDGASVTLSSEETAALTFKSGGDIQMECQSGDTEADRSSINFVCANYTAKIQSDYDDDTITIYPSTTETMSFYVGSQPWIGGGSYQPFDTIQQTVSSYNRMLVRYSSGIYADCLVQEKVSSTYIYARLLAQYTGSDDQVSIEVRALTGTDCYAKIRTASTDRFKIDVDGKVWLYTGPLEIDIGSGDPIIIFDTQGADKFTIGVDDSDGDKFKINTGGSLADNSFFEIDSSGNVTLRINESVVTPNEGLILQNIHTSSYFSPRICFQQADSVFYDYASAIGSVASILAFYWTDDAWATQNTYASFEKAKWGIAQAHETSEGEVAGTMYLVVFKDNSFLDEGYIDLFANTHGVVTITFHSASYKEYIHAMITDDEVVTVMSASANVVLTDTDTKFCVFDDTGHVRVKNRMGESGEFRLIYYYA